MSRDRRYQVSGAAVKPYSVNWVNYSEKRPPCAGLYLVADRAGDLPYIAYYTKANGFTENDDDGYSLDQWITHWVPLPSMPTDTSAGVA
jgi:hypothetical protein